MSQTILEQVTEIIHKDPHAAQSLLLFALVKTLDMQKSGHMYMLEKLREMSPENRTLAYGLMEMMASGQTHTETWQQAVESMESTIRGD